MRLLIQDTARNNLATWASRAVTDGLATDVVISPFASPVNGNGYKASASDNVDRLRDAGATVWFDPMTHALQFPHAGDFRYYDEWDLWDGERNRLTGEQNQKDHIERVLAIQEGLGCMRLAPTIFLSSPSGLLAQLALDIASVAKQVSGNEVWLSIAGDSQFWGTGAELDSFVGALDQLEPAGWYLTVVRSTAAIPQAATPEEVFGMMRTVAALSADREVVIAHGDLAGLPAIAAGASGVGTGWDARQRSCAQSDYVERPEGENGGQWFQRPTLGGLLGVLSRRAYATLRSEDPRRAQRLTPGEIAAGVEPTFSHHLRVLTTLLETLGRLDGKARVDALSERYAAASADWRAVQAIAGTPEGARHWIDPLAEGVQLFAASEGW